MTRARLVGRSHGAAAAVALRSEINVTPLVDVCLVLLIIFMLVTPLLHQGLDVALPRTAHPSRLPELPGQLTVSIRWDGSVFLNDHWATRDRLGATLRTLHDGGAIRQVIVQADRGLRYQAVTEVLAQVRDAGFARFGLAADRAPQGVQ